jgi:hypothetical protein
MSAVQLHGNAYAEKILVVATVPLKGHLIGVTWGIAEAMP